MESKKLIGLFFQKLCAQSSEYLDLRHQLDAKKVELTLTGKRIALLRNAAQEAEDSGLFVQNDEFMCKEG